MVRSEVEATSAAEDGDGLLLSRKATTSASAHVEAAVLDHQAELPAFEGLEGPPQVLPAQRAAVDYHVVRLADLAALAPRQPAG